MLLTSSRAICSDEKGKGYGFNLTGSFEDTLIVRLIAFVLARSYEKNIKKGIDQIVNFSLLT